MIHSFKIVVKRPRITKTIQNILNFKTNLRNHRKWYSTSQISSTRSSILHTVLKLRDKNTSNSIIDKTINELCIHYKSLSKEQKQNLLVELACNYSVHQKKVYEIATSLINDQYNESQTIKIQEKLKIALTPQYKWLFIHVGRQRNGVKFLVDMRTDLLELLQMKNISDSNAPYLQQLSNTLRELFLLWFSVGFLKLERITWKSSCDMLQKISDYEAVHPVRNWADLKKRMGPDRRCFVYTHSSMPDEPLVILHTALRSEIVNSTTSILTQNSNAELIQQCSDNFQPDTVKAAMFYSISSTQIGLQGIELGNYIIKRVAKELSKEFPQLDQFSSLSPIPKFKSWLFNHLKSANNGAINVVFKKNELEKLKNVLKTEDIYSELLTLLNGNNWLQIPELVSVLEPIVMRLCVHYLYVEKKRGYALDSVANFHLRNGAEMWRINWLADLSARGLTTSCGIMVNYRYYLNKTDYNSQTYIENKEITTSPLVRKLLDQK